MKYLLPLLAFLIASINTSAQDKYSYISDRKFFEPSELIGYQFVPAAMEMPNEYDRDIDPGEYTFGITANNLYVTGEGLEGVFSIVNIGKTEYGFIIKLMNARNPTLQGHLKIILTKHSHVEAVVFKRGTKEAEMVFYMAAIPHKEHLQDKAFFTHASTKIVHTDSLWGKQMRPFFRVDLARKIQERLVAADSVSIEFIEEIVLTEKVKKPKKVKPAKVKKNKKVAEEEEYDEEEEFEEEEEEEDLYGEEDEGAIPPKTAEMAEAERNVKIKEERFYTIRIKQMLPNEAEELAVKTWNIPIKKVTQREDELAGPGEERYQIEFETTKGPKIYMYLTTEKQITGFELNKTRFEMYQ